MEINLSLEQFQMARNYLMKYGRDLEQGLFQFYFDNGSSDNVIKALQNYQGEDGATIRPNPKSHG